jgi:hypothetical protein
MRTGKPTKSLQAKGADVILEILEKVDENPDFFRKAARKEKISKNQLVAAAIAQAIWELLEADVFGTE